MESGDLRASEVDVYGICVCLYKLCGTKECFRIVRAKLLSRIPKFKLRRTCGWNGTDLGEQRAVLWACREVLGSVFRVVEKIVAANNCKIPRPLSFYANN